MAKTTLHTTRGASTHHRYRDYLIRWSQFTITKPDARVWVEKDHQFICWAQDVDTAKRKIDEVCS